MPVCDECGTEYETLKNTCRYCDGEFCPDHHLPEKHDCPGLDNLGVGTRHFESAAGDASTGPRTLGEPKDDQDDEDESPDALEHVRTHGGSGRDQSDADFVSSPDVNPDGTLDESEVEPVNEEFRSQMEEPEESEHPYAYLWIYVITAVVVVVLQFGFGVNVLSLLPGL